MAAFSMPADHVTVRTLLADREVQEWLDGLRKHQLVPVKRTTNILQPACGIGHSGPFCWGKWPVSAEKGPAPYPPPWMDSATLAARL